MSEQNYPWGTREDHYKKTLKYLDGRRKGEITSFQTPWPRINNIGVQGIEWGTAIAFCARPAVGKSVLVDQLVRDAKKLNPNEDLRILKFELEMLPQVTVIREFSSVLEQSYTYVCSAEEVPETDDWGNPTGKYKSISKEELIKCWEYAQRKIQTEGETAHFPENIIDMSPTVKEFEKIIDLYMDAYKKGEIGEDGKEKIIYAKTLVTIDHLRLFVKEDRQTELEMLYEASIAINRLKKKYHDSIIFVALNHLNREVNAENRTENGKHGNYLRDSDIFGADAIMQNFDIVVVMDRPAARNITKYGPSLYIIDNPSILVYQYVKVRNGVPAMSFFSGEFDKMRIVEIDPPPKAQRKIQTSMKFKNKQEPEENEQPEFIF